MKYINKELTALEQRKYNIARIIESFLFAIGVAIVLIYFESLSVVIPCFLVLLAIGIYFTHL